MSMYVHSRIITEKVLPPRFAFDADLARHICIYNIYIYYIYIYVIYIYRTLRPISDQSVVCSGLRPWVPGLRSHGLSGLGSPVSGLGSQVIDLESRAQDSSPLVVAM